MAVEIDFQVAGLDLILGKHQVKTVSTNVALDLFREQGIP